MKGVETSLADIPAAIIIGFIGGLLGSGFIYFNTQINIKRKKYLTNKVLKTLEAMGIILITVTIWYFAPMADNNQCLYPDPQMEPDTMKSYLCPPN